MSTAAQNFNVDLLFLYATTRVYRAQISGTPSFDKGKPAFAEGKTDWNRRAITLPNISKSIGNWTGNFETTEVSFQLADTDGSVTGTLYQTGLPFGTKVAIYSKVAQNPTYWSPVFEGNITKVERTSGLTSLFLEDNVRNLHNSRFVPDYLGLATFISPNLYGTVKDVIGSNVYIDDRGDVQLIERKTEESGNWFGAIFGAALGAVGFLTGVGAGLIGVGAGFIRGIPSGNVKSERYYKVTDYNAIPDGAVLGGQPLKFSQATVSGIATNISGPLFNVPSYKVKGGQFTNGIYGTLEMDDILHDVHKGDYVYAEMPIIFAGSPDTIIVDMLTGSNTTVKYNYPRDFSDDWFAQSSPLRHIDCYAQLENYKIGGVQEAINSLAEEFAFSFYLDETNRFAIRSIRELNPYGTQVIGTLSENYNILNDGIKRVDDIKTSFTDIEISYNDTYIGAVYEQTHTVSMPSATYFGAIQRVKQIKSKWMHDFITARFMGSRYARRYGSSVANVEFETSLYAVPIALGEIISLNGWAVGTGAPYEVTSYEKDFTNSIARVTADDGAYYYKERGFFTLATANGVVDTASKSGFATVLGSRSTTTSNKWATLLDSMAADDVRATLYDDVSNNLSLLLPIADPSTPGFFTFGNDEILRGVEAVSVFGTEIAGVSYNKWILEVERAQGNTMPLVQPSSGTFKAILLSTNINAGLPAATLLNIAPSLGTIFRWF